MNTFKTGLLMSLLMGLFLVVGALVGGASGMLIAFVMAAGLNLFAYWNSDKMLLSHVWRAPGGCGQRAGSLSHCRAAGGQARICPCPRFSFPKIPSPMPSPPGAIPNMPRSASPAGLLAQGQQ